MPTWEIQTKTKQVLREGKQGKTFAHKYSQRNA